MAISFGAIKGRTQKSICVLPPPLSLSLLFTPSLLLLRPSSMAVARPYEGFSGKFRRRPIRRTAGTPYDRPASANQSVRIQSATADKKKRCLSKLVDPLRIIASSASRIFSFQTCLTAPPEAPGMAVPCTDENHHSCKRFSEVACTIPEKEFASPAELAKEFMGSGLSKAPSSALSLRNQLFREDALPSIIPYGRQISQISTAPKFVTHFSGISEPHRNGYMTPISIGRSSRSPYFWAPSATNIMVCKRGSSVLENDLGCPGSIRRLRQKYNLRSPSKDIHRSHGNRLPDPSTTLNSNGTESLKFPVEKPLAPLDYTSDLNEDNKVANGKEKIGSSATDFAKSGSVAVSSGRRPAFQMRAPEVDFDLDDDDYKTNEASNRFPTGNIRAV